MKKPTIQEKLDESQKKLDIIMARLTKIEQEVMEMKQVLMPNDYDAHTFTVPHNLREQNPDNFYWVTTTNGIN